MVQSLDCGGTWKTNKHIAVPTKMLTAQVTAAELMHKATTVHTTHTLLEAINTWWLDIQTKHKEKVNFFLLLQVCL
jgi:hypothetical protein